MTYQSLRPVPLSVLADQWGAPEAHFWLRGVAPERPVAFDEQAGLWNVYGYPEAVEVFSDPAAYTSDTVPYIAPDAPEYEKSGLLTQMDPPAHRQLRQLVARAFTPRLVAGLAPRISALTHELLDQADGRGALELVDDLAHPLPVTVIAELLGVPASDRPLFRQWSEEIFPREKETARGGSAGTDGGGAADGDGGSGGASGTDGGSDEVAAAFDLSRRMNEYFAVHVDDRRRQPREDMLTRLVQAEVDGERLSEAALGNFAQLLLVAGHITTTMLLGNTVLCLDAHPERRAELRRDPAALPAVIEESLRLLTPFEVFYRATTRDVELGGQRVPAGQVLALWTGAANRDERVFAGPHDFVPGRDPNPHLAFGRGIHFCLGAPLARLEGRIALGILLERHPELRTDPDNPPVLMANPELTGPRTLPLLTAGRPGMAA
ncbi:cytochrome P450 [Streptomyces aureoverticillatus]|uniref:cytochrome P450 n=1 Tax=Streptomyces aureoverticillatus TaxID=66871 RepID=UPI0013DD7C93|nr:cytochrome P450 [Streptomyces aureoverticillatus]QIB42408.1 cytochrome P450 [Streptomyces aureoverticillatus]